MKGWRMNTRQIPVNQATPSIPADACAQERKTGHHLLLPEAHALSRYPHDYEEMVSLHEVGPFEVRAIRAADADLIRAMFLNLSPHSIYMRFFSSFKKLSDERLARLTQIDYDREIALAAVQRTEQQVHLLAMAQVIETSDPLHGEFAVLVADPFQGKGIGACLLLRCMGIATLRGMRHLCGLVLAENTQMLALGRKLNFTITRIPQSTEYELTIDLPGNLYPAETTSG